MKRQTLLLLLLMGLLPFSYGQNLEALKKKYNQLTTKYEKELSEQRADYIFVIDVSGTMYNYKSVVVPALKEFIGSLQDGDHVSLIKFGLKASCEDLGNSLTIDDVTKKTLYKKADEIYTKPQKGTQERKDYYDITDIHNMMTYLDGNMQLVTGRHPIKFVFLITDFVHETGPADWEGLKTSFGEHQRNNIVKVFALQLPVQSSGFEPVMKEAHLVFDQFGFDPTPVSDVDSRVLSEWFTLRKDRILLDKFKAIVGSKLKDPELIVNPVVDVDGNMEVSFSWRPNELFDSIRINSLMVNDTRFSIENFEPVTMKESSAKMDNLKLKYGKASWWLPVFKDFDGEVVVEASYPAPYVDEVRQLLGKEITDIEASAPMEKRVFCYPLSLRQFIIVLLIIICYLIISIWALVRNGRYTLKGKMYVDKNSINLTETKSAENKKSIEIGRQGSFLRVEDCRWKMRIYVKTTNAFIPILHLKGPVVKVAMVEGAQFKVNGTKYASDKSPAIVQFSNISVDEYHIHWIHN